MYSSESDETKAASSRSLRGSLSSLPGPGELIATPTKLAPSMKISFFIDHLRRIRTNQTGRSLVDLTGNKDIFIYLHKYFIFLLKAGGQRVIECVLEGPPRVMASPQRSLSVSQDGSMDEDNSLDKPLTTLDFKVVKVEGQPFFQSLKHLFKVVLWN